MPEYVMRCSIGPVTCLAWLGNIKAIEVEILRKDPESDAAQTIRETVLRRCGHALQNRLEMDVAHPVMDHGRIHLPGTPNFREHYSLASETRQEYEAWKNQQKMEEMISVMQPMHDLATNELDVVIEVVIMTSGCPYEARTVISANVARRHFVEHNRRTTEGILRRAKEQMLASEEYRNCKIWYDLDRYGAWTIEFIDVVEEPEPEPEPKEEPEPEQLTLPD